MSTFTCREVAATLRGFSLVLSWAQIADWIVQIEVQVRGWMRFAFSSISCRLVSTINPLFVLWLPGGRRNLRRNFHLFRLLCRRKVFLKVVHSSVLNAGFVTKAFEQHEALLHGAVGKTSFCLAKAVQKNEFRRRCLQWRREE